MLDLLCALGLPIWSPLLTEDLCRGCLQSATRHRGGKPNLVLPDGIGSAVFLQAVDDIPASVHAAARALLAARSARPAGGLDSSSLEDSWPPSETLAESPSS